MTSPTRAATSPPHLALQVAGGSNTRGDDLCGEPRRLSSGDVFEINGDDFDIGWLVISQTSGFYSREHRARSLAHELGHVLLLGHGNSEDGNGDGEEAGVTGPRRFDEYCDPLGAGASCGSCDAGAQARHVRTSNALFAFAATRCAWRWASSARGLGFHATADLLALVTAIGGAASVANLMLIVLDITCNGSSSRVASDAEASAAVSAA